ncbi:MAG: hypothetical protein D6812_12725 [Deltaproteobacteria bacterium]|nr:MAG: hypothetical protein D6812_12725 [Deltaproteobacteria bacterium]
MALLPIVVALLGGLGPGSCGSPEPEDFACTEVIGFSQTRQWYVDSDFETLVEDGAWQLRAPSGASIDRWADPTYAGWAQPPYSSCTEGDSTAPDRVLLTVSGDFGEDVRAWVEAIEAVVHLIQEEKYPQVERIMLQAVVGGPQAHGDPPCPAGDGFVRASYQQPYIYEATQIVAEEENAAGRDVIPGADPHVERCEDYQDATGHLTSGASLAVGHALGEYYAQ